ncbi:Retrotransposable element Tf2 [Senna tora]|uniref:Retrotransposable element Tf2 n=1 Tax=Senna tora TaxID=362788 RepID=A0A834VYF3_9FABA|nr:Retrotransposable element Tf2 [Senna tora]
MREMAEAMKRQADAANRILQHIQGDRDDRPQGHRGRDGHYATDCPQKKQTSEGAKPPTKGRVFPLKGEAATESDDLIEGTCMINGIDVILGMNWLFENQVVLNCCEKSVTFADTNTVNKRNEGKSQRMSFLCSSEV